jgi:hypothetical protein
VPFGNIMRLIVVADFLTGGSLTKASCFIKLGRYQRVALIADAASHGVIFANVP